MKSSREADGEMHGVCKHKMEMLNQKYQHSHWNLDSPVAPAETSGVGIGGQAEPLASKAVADELPPPG